MNESTATALNDTTQKTEFVLRRLEEPLRVGPVELPPALWVAALGVVLLLGVFYVCWMYFKDSKGVGIGWAMLLGVLRLTVYALIASVFLLPSMQTFIVSQSEGKVLVLFDVSGSMHTPDELPSGGESVKLPTRQDKVLAFLGDPKADFFEGLQKKNPTSAFRFGTKLDDQALHFVGGRVFTRQERDEPTRDENGAVVLPEIRPVSREYLEAWLRPVEKPEVNPDLTGRDKERMVKLAEVNATAFKDGLTKGTNLGDSLLAAFNKEVTNRLQGIVVFTDGRHTEGSPAAFRDLEARAKAAGVPLFVVGVGEDRQKVKQEIVDVRLPEQVQPEDTFRGVVELTGEGLAGQKADVSLDLVYSRKKKGKDGKEEEELLPIRLIEAEDPMTPRGDPKSDKRTTIDLGKKLTFKAPADVAFDKGTPPRAIMEIQLDAAALAAAAKIDLTEGMYRGRKWEIAETSEGEFKFQARVPVDKREGLKEKEHVSGKTEVRVLKKPLRVLLVAAGANRDYQFVRTLLFRESEKKRIEMSVHLQLPPGEDKVRAGRVQDVPPDRFLTAFPETYEAKPGAVDDLASYDVIVAFDPDWNRFTRDQIQNLRKWCRAGGGLILIGGYINTVELIRPRDGEEADRYAPILELLPVVLDDRRDAVERKTDDPWPLDFEGATPEFEFLKLDEALTESQFKEDWQAFFYGAGKEAKKEIQRGFFNFYPVLRHKPGSTVIARFGDPAGKLKDGSLHPYLVLSPRTNERVVWIGSAETWRLREYKEEFHERFWTKLCRYAASKSSGGSTRRILPSIAKKFVAGRPVEAEARIDRQGGVPLERTAKPEITLLEYPVGVAEKDAKKAVVMTPRTAQPDGWFTGKFQVSVPGNYTLQIRVPETGATETHKFSVDEANPELDNTRPDYYRMYSMASEADMVLPRMEEADKQALRKRLQRPDLKAGAGAGGAEEKERGDSSDDKPRLYFDLKNADLIPSCMRSDVKKQRSKGPAHDLWDEGWTVYTYPKPEDPAQQARPPVKISYFLIAAVGLLSIEWLIRKLLRLA